MSELFDYLLGRSRKDRPQGFSNAVFEYDIILSHLGKRGETNLGGLRILDLGCGTGTSWPPYFCRLGAKMGASVYGIDLSNASIEDFTIYNHIVADLVPLIMEGRLHNFSQLGGGKFDIIHEALFASGFTSPVLQNTLERYKGYYSEPLLDDFKAKMRDEAKHLLKNGGVLKTFDGVYKKSFGRLVFKRY